MNCFFRVTYPTLVTAKELLRTVFMAKTTIKTHSIKSSRRICLKNHIKTQPLFPSSAFPSEMYHRALTPQCNFAFVKTQLLISTSLTPLTDFLLSHADKRMKCV